MCEPGIPRVSVMASAGRESPLRRFAVFAVLVLWATLCSADPPGGYYTTKYDHLDVENILNQKRLVLYYSACLLDKGPCTPQGIEFKRILPESIRTNCLRCTEKQRFHTIKSIRRLRKEYPDVWKELAAIWDPTGEFVQRLEESGSKPNKIPEAVAAAATNVNIDVQPVEQPKTAVVVNRFGDSDSAESSTTANKIANKPVSFATTTTTQKPSTSVRITTKASPLTSTKVVTVQINYTPFGTTKKTIGIAYNYDFAFTAKPSVAPPRNGLNVVIQGVNNIIAPIADIAGRVITAGTDLAGMVLNSLGVRRT